VNLKDSPIILGFYSQNFSPLYSFKPAHYSSFILKQHNAASQSWLP